MLTVENLRPTGVRFADGTATEVADSYLTFYLDRYIPSYRAELDHFVTAVGPGTQPEPGFADGRATLALADAAGQASARVASCARVSEPSCRQSQQAERSPGGGVPTISTPAPCRGRRPAAGRPGPLVTNPCGQLPRAVQHLDRGEPQDRPVVVAEVGLPGEVAHGAFLGAVVRRRRTRPRAGSPGRPCRGSTARPGVAGRGLAGRRTRSISRIRVSIGDCDRRFGQPDDRRQAARCPGRRDVADGGRRRQRGRTGGRG